MFDLIGCHFFQDTAFTCQSIEDREFTSFLTEDEVNCRVRSGVDAMESVTELIELDRIVIWTDQTETWELTILVVKITSSATHANVTTQ